MTNKDVREFVEYFQREYAHDPELVSAVSTAWINFNVMKNRELDSENK